MNAIKMMNVLKMSGAVSKPAMTMAAGVRAFHASAIRNIKEGETFPDVEVVEDSPGNKVNLLSELKQHKKAVVVGVPAAFSPACSSTHIPGFIKADSGIPTFVVSVNDPFVMKAWGESLGSANNIRYLGDPGCKLTKALDMDWDGTTVFGNARSKRYALVLENATVKKVFVEPDNTGLKETTAEKVLASV